MALLPVPPAPPPAPPGAEPVEPAESPDIVTSDQFNDLIKIQTNALTALTDIRNELVKSASAMAEMRLEALAAAGAAGTGAAEGAAKGGGGAGKGMLGKLGGLMKGAGAAGLGAGLGVAAVLAGAGLAAGGVALLLNTLAEPGLGKGIKENVNELLSINEGNAKILQGLDLAATFAVIGAGLLVFSVAKMGAGIAEVVNTFSQSVGGRPFAEAIKEDIETLLSIKVTALDATSLAASMLALAVGISVFSIGAGVASISQIVATLGSTLGGMRFSDAIKYDVETLMGIKVGVLDATKLAASLLALGVGISVFSIGAGVASISQIVATLGSTLGGMRFSDAIKYDVEKLMSIQVGVLDAAGLAASLLLLGVGISVFSLGAGVATIGELGATLGSTLGGMRFSDAIKYDVEKLMSINVGVMDAAGLAASLLLLAVGVSVFAIGQGVASIGQLTSTLGSQLGGMRFSDAIKYDVEKLMSINVGLLDAAGLAASLLLLGVGVSVFALGQGVATSAELVATLGSQLGGMRFSDAIKYDVETLMGIKVGLLDAAGLAASLLLLGVGVSVFALGQGVASSAQLVTTLGSQLGGMRFSDAIKYDVETLMSIKAGVLDAAGLSAALLLLAVGVSVFSIGAGVATIGQLGETLGSTLGGMRFSDAIKYDVETLMSIKGTVTEAAGFAAAMLAIGLGLAVFSLGAGMATMAQLGDTFGAMLGGLRFSDAVKYDVETLMSIKTSFTEAVGFAAAMGMIAAGLGVFALAKAAGGAANLVDAFNQKLGGLPYAEGIKHEVETLMSIGGKEGITQAKGEQFKLAMFEISKGLATFTGAKFLDSLAGAVGGLLNFLSGNQSPVEAVLGLADNVDELERVGTALQSISKGLGTFAGLKGIGDVDIKEMTENLKESLPDLEKAIMGGHVDTKGWGGVDIKGLASPDIKYKEAAANLNAMMQSVSGALPTMVKGAGGAIQPGGDATAQMIESMIIKTAIIESAIIQGPGAGAIEPTPGGGATVNNNTVTVSPSSVNSISSSSVTEATYGTTDPYTGGISSGRFD